MIKYENLNTALVKSDKSYFKCIEIIKDMYSQNINIKDQQAIKTYLHSF